MCGQLINVKALNATKHTKYAGTVNRVHRMSFCLQRAFRLQHEVNVGVHDEQHQGRDAREECIRMEQCEQVALELAARVERDTPDEIPQHDA